ncbi:MAG: amino acid permease [Proteobacteria bacterium]|nr:amino acid permease [Pseudomonadota bacterium]MBU1736943.1 amino acid permease [Pseudomonadota bacterium]
MPNIKASEAPGRAVKNNFGTFGGVFTPSILTILGVIMFMRANFVVGEAGIIGAVIILMIAKSITLATSLSIAAVSTNLQVRGGGLYYLISRSLGIEFGGAIGIALFFALALSVPFYILGFAEALVISYPKVAPYFLVICLTTATTLFLIAYYGAGLALKTQFVIMCILFLSIVSFLGGGILGFSTERFITNLAPGYSFAGAIPSTGIPYSFWGIFALYFPAVTGIAAGVNMSGDLKDPGTSIPRGTLAAVSVGFAIYLAQILVSGGAWERADLISNPFGLLKENALFGFSGIVVAGVVAATLSSALGSLLGAPRILQAVSRDRIIKLLFFFAKGTKKGDEPRRALLLTYVITLLVLFWAGNDSGGAALNAIAAIITMFFLYTYGMINLSAFIEDFGDNPSFRPRFQFYHWVTALLGSLACVAVSLLINWVAAVGAILIIVIFFWYIRTRKLIAAFGDARRGFVYNAIRKNLLRLSRMPEDSKNWRPTMLVFSGNPTVREPLVKYATWIAAKRGLVYLADILEGDFTKLAPRRPGVLKQLEKFCQEKDIEAFPSVVTANTVEEGVSMLLQATETGPIHPNVAIFGWSSEYGNLLGYLRQLRMAAALEMNIFLFSVKGLPLPQRRKRIDVWWRGKKNGGMMLLAAHLITESWEWEDTEIRILRVVEKEEGRIPASEALAEIINLSRVKAYPQVIVCDNPFEIPFREYSADADCIFLGFELPEEEDEKKWHGFYQKLLHKMPTTILVNSQLHEIAEV